MVEREHCGLPSFSYKSTDPIMKIPLSGPHLNLITSLRPHLMPSHWGLGLQRMDLGGNTNIQCITVLVCTCVPCVPACVPMCAYVSAVSMCVRVCTCVCVPEG